MASVFDAKHTADAPVCSREHEQARQAASSSGVEDTPHCCPVPERRTHPRDRLGGLGLAIEFGCSERRNLANTFLSALWRDPLHGGALGS